MLRATLITLILAAALPALGCGQSAQQKAKDQACSAGARAARQVTRLDTTPLSQLDAERVLGELTAIAANLKQVRDSLGSLDAAKAQELRAAEAAFQEQFGPVIYKLVGGRTLGTKNLEADLQPDLTTLAAHWRATIAPTLKGWCP